MSGHFAASFRRFARASDGATMIEFALIFPVVLMLTFGVLEVSLCMASLVTLEGGLKEASRYGITSQNPGSLDPAELAKVPTPFKVGDDPRLEQIGLILDQNTLNLIDLNAADVDINTFSSFSVIKDGEPYTDLDGNGQYSPDYDNGNDANGKPLPKGEPYSDMNCNKQWDDAGPSGTGPGAPGDIVVYTINYYWNILTPIIGQWLGQADPNKPGHYRIAMTASIVVKNEPSFSGSSFCS
jgi:Flp pilus assembly pilin Flp